MFHRRHASGDLGAVCMDLSFCFNVLQVKLIEARNLPGMDSKGLSDAYVNVSLRSKSGTKVGSRKSRVIYKSLNPVWKETFSFSVPENTDLNLFFRVWNHELVTHGFMGQCVIPMADWPTATETRWLKLFVDGVERGEIVPEPPPALERMNTANLKLVESDTALYLARGYVVLCKWRAKIWARHHRVFAVLSTTHLRFFEPKEDHGGVGQLFCSVRLSEIKSEITEKDEGGQFGFVFQYHSEKKQKLRQVWILTRTPSARDIWLEKLKQAAAAAATAAANEPDRHEMTSASSSGSLAADEMVISLPDDNHSDNHECCVRLITQKNETQELVLSHSRACGKTLCCENFSSADILNVYLTNDTSFSFSRKQLQNDCSFSVSKTKRVKIKTTFEPVSLGSCMSRELAICGVLSVGIGLALHVPDYCRFLYFASLVVFIFWKLCSTRWKLKTLRFKLEESEETSMVESPDMHRLYTEDHKVTKMPWGSWSSSESNLLKLRGPTYLDDRVKIPASDSFMRLAHLEFFLTKDKLASAIPESPFLHAREPGKYDANSVVDKLKHLVFIVHFQVPGDPWYSLVAYFVYDTACSLKSDDPFYLCVDRFLRGDEEFRNKRLKFIPQVVEGNWMVQKGVGSSPAILGTKLAQSSKYDPEANLIEIVVDVSSSQVGGTILKLVKGAAKSLVIDLNFLVEGQERDELPERLIGGIRLAHCDLNAVQPRETRLPEREFSLSA